MPNDNINIYIDFDNTLADTNKGLLDLFNDHITNFDDVDLWLEIKRYCDEQNNPFWSELEMVEDMQLVWKRILDYNVKILTTDCGYVQCSLEQKRKWIYTHFGEVDVISVQRDADKSQYVTGKNDILIDDSDECIYHWCKNGGRAILHKTANDTIVELESILD